MPMVWYIPPLSPVVDVVRDTGEDAEDQGNLFAAIDALRIPIEYLAELFTAGDIEPVDGVLKKLAAMRSYMRDINMGRNPNGEIPASVGMSEEDMYDMYRLLAIAKYDERYVIPSAHAEQAHSLEELATECSVSEYGGGQQDLFGEGSGMPTPIAVENFQMLQARQTSDTLASPVGQGGRGSTCSTGTARATPPPGSSRRSRTRRRPARHRRDRAAPPAPPAGRTCDEAAQGPSPEADAVGARSWPSPGSRRRCCSTIPTRGCWSRSRRCGPHRTSCPRALGEPMRDLLLHLRSAPLPGAAGRLRRDVRHPPAQLPVPHLLRPRRHPQEGGGAAALQADLPALRLRPRRRQRPRRRAARPPLRRARVRRHRRPEARLGAAHRPPGRPGAAADGAARRRLAVGRLPSSW